MNSVWIPYLFLLLSGFEARADASKKDLAPAQEVSSREVPHPPSSPVDLRQVALEKATRAISVPPGFHYEVLVQHDIQGPVDLAFSPDGLLWIATQAGKIWTYSLGTKKKQLVTELSLLEAIGMHGLVFDPNFSSNGYIYIFYTRKIQQEYENRVSRFTVKRSPEKMEVDLASEFLLTHFAVKNIGDHQGGALCFNPKDKTLYVGTGDDLPGDQTAVFSSKPMTPPQDLGDLRGKILRLHLDGSIPSDNPFVGVSGTRGEIFTFGHRQVYTLSLDALTGNLYAGDIGYDREEDFEEINLVAAGANYGWPRCIGNNRGTMGGDCPIANAVPPWFSYARGKYACVICGPFYRTTSTTNGFPPPYQHGLFYADYSRRTIRFIQVERDTNEPIKSVPFASGFICCPLAVKLGPDGALYLAEFAGYQQISRIVYDPNPSVAH